MITISISALLEEAIASAKEIKDKEKRLAFARGIDICLSSAWVDYDTRELVFNEIMENVILYGDVVGGFRYSPDGQYEEVIMMPTCIGDDADDEWNSAREIYENRFGKKSFSFP